MAGIEYKTTHETKLSLAKFIGVILLIYCAYRYIKCLFITKSCISAFSAAVFDDAAPIIIVVLLIYMIISFIDWAIYSFFKKKVLSSGTIYNGIIKEEIKQTRISRGGGYLTYKYIVELDDGTTVKSPVYISRIYHKKCIVHKYLGIIVLTDFE